MCNDRTPSTMRGMPEPKVSRNMKVTLDLDTREKQALFLMVTNRLFDVDEFVRTQLQKDYGYKPDFEEDVQALAAQNSEAMLNLLESIFTFNEWSILKEEFDKGKCQ